MNQINLYVVVVVSIASLCCRLDQGFIMFLIYYASTDDKTLPVSFLWFDLSDNECWEHATATITKYVQLLSLNTSLVASNTFVVVLFNRAAYERSWWGTCRGEYCPLRSDPPSNSRRLSFRSTRLESHPPWTPAHRHCPRYSRTMRDTVCSHPQGSSPGIRKLN